MYDPHDPEQVSERRTRRKARAATDQLDLAWVASDPRGRRVLLRILNETQFMAGSFVPGDPLATAFREGQRDIGIKLHTVLTNAGEGVLSNILMESLNADE
ncbi:hypothetical protein LU298_11435 [Komagataeibacter intermedius]|uniref:Bbp19-like phage domain-containing protein n=2 Tax=Komagataeibacter intermedius TaxID=66229 RepID=A0A0N1FAH8_9PROT|nr:hypothetical protein [Komagataeibacter intermedius]KPH86509.1 hypothetical protein GLUCOINTEAF2_0202713 [Komagataeibacter intermedius AF2]MCF3637105.1 hypothetical protein [Komagataeibacter intermedius]GAN88044.1 hypothetical protein Gain_0127_010 [Komagataeibacter intermedius TF2]GBQ69349.1 hypothetical protein AA0521_1453 [Komagataeibacter intermedius NRIC 0521]